MWSVLDPELITTERAKGKPGTRFAPREEDEEGMTSDTVSSLGKNTVVSSASLKQTSSSLS